MYDALTLEQKKALHEKHRNRSHKNGAKDSTLPFNSKPKTKASAKTMISKCSIHGIATAVAGHHSGNDSTGSTSSDEELDMKEALHKKTKVSSNCNKSALHVSEHDIFCWPPLALLPYVWRGSVLMHKYLIMILEPNSTLTLIPLLLVPLWP